MESAPEEVVPEATQASARATRLVMMFTFVVLGALALLTLIGPHVPAGG